jgi:hypothetical protein
LRALHITDFIHTSNTKHFCAKVSALVKGILEEQLREAIKEELDTKAAAKCILTDFSEPKIQT